MILEFFEHISEMINRLFLGMNSQRYATKQVDKKCTKVFDANKIDDINQYLPKYTENDQEITCEEKNREERKKYVISKLDTRAPLDPSQRSEDINIGSGWYRVHCEDLDRCLKSIDSILDTPNYHKV